MVIVITLFISFALNNIITMDMVSQILTAQNFSMPAGTIQDAGISYMVSVGEEITELAQMEELLLFDMGMEGVEPIYLTDVAAVMLTDNRNDTDSKLNGEDSITLQFEKQSTYATAEAANNIEARFRELEKEYAGLKFVSLMNQGDYIYMIVETILSSLLLGAVFAVVGFFILRPLMSLLGALLLPRRKRRWALRMFLVSLMTAIRLLRSCPIQMG